MRMDHSYRVFETQPLESERGSKRADRLGLEAAAGCARAAWDDYSRLRRSSCRTGDPAAAARPGCALTARWRTGNIWCLAPVR
jgi:hypothetical protein